MRLFAVLVAICALCQPAMAQTPECKSISNASARLACYDKAASPVAASATAKPPLRTAPGSKLDSEKLGNEKYVDPISAEDDLVNARLKNICRGC
jgi:hypothetical protein